MQPDASHRIVLPYDDDRRFVRCVRPFRATREANDTLYPVSTNTFCHCRSKTTISRRRARRAVSGPLISFCCFEPATSKRLVHTLQLLLCEIPFLQIIDFPSATERASYPLLSSAGWLQDVVEWSWTVHVWIATTDERGHSSSGMRKLVQSFFLAREV